MVTRLMRLVFFGAGLLVMLGPVLASPLQVELNYQLRPEQDLLAESVTQSVTTMRVLEDRGVVAKSQGRLSRQGATFNSTTRERYRYITGATAADGSFSVEIRFLDKTIHLIGPDGQTQLMPERESIMGLRVQARMEQGGAVREGSVVVDGVSPDKAARMQPVMMALLQQVASVKPIHLTQGESVSHEMALQIPAPGIAPIDVKTHIANRLLDVEDGVARIQQIITMNFGSGDDAQKISAEGSGAGMLHYDVAKKLLVSNSSGTLMKLVMNVTDGVLEIQMNARQTLTMRSIDNEGEPTRQP